MNRIRICVAFLVCSFAGLASAATTTVQPNEVDSKDVFVYQGLPTTNLETFAPSFQALLSAGKTGTGHDIESLLQFDLTGVLLNVGEAAFINLWVGDTSVTGFGATPSAAHPVVIDLYANTGSWNESTVTWNSGRPAHDVTPIATLTISGKDQWVNFDITSQLASWLATPGSNFGVTIVQNAVVLNDEAQKVVAVFDSASGSNRPSLSVVPEPASIGWLAVSGALVALRRRRKEV